MTKEAGKGVVDFWEFMQSWTFMAIMVGLLCILVLLIPVGIAIVILFASRANRRDREKHD